MEEMNIIISKENNPDIEYKIKKKKFRKVNRYRQ